jgi:hypothetical protein
MSEYNTNPTIETVLERIEALRIEMNAGFDSLRTEMTWRFDAIYKCLRRQQDIVDEFIEQVIEMRRDLKEQSRL